STADFGEANAAHSPSPVCLNNQPPCPSIALRNTSSWAASAARMPSASASHRRVEPSTSVNRNVTTPEGAGTSAECHNKPCFHLEHHRTTQTTDHGIHQAGSQAVQCRTGNRRDCEQALNRHRI